MSTRQGSASYVIVIGVLMALIVGAFLLTFVVYPITNTFRGSALWSMDTTAGNRVLMAVGGVWEFWGAIILLALLAFVFVVTRQ